MCWDTSGEAAMYHEAVDGDGVGTVAGWCLRVNRGQQGPRRTYLVSVTPAGHGIQSYRRPTEP